jgi:hypothetical protein
MEQEEKDLIRSYGTMMSCYGLMNKEVRIIKEKMEEIEELRKALEVVKLRGIKSQKGYEKRFAHEFIKHREVLEARLEDIKRYSLKVSKFEGVHDTIEYDLDEMKNFYEKSISYANDKISFLQGTN